MIKQIDTETLREWLDTERPVTPPDLETGANRCAER
jgi:hypothetical protein